MISSHWAVICSHCLHIAAEALLCLGSMMSQKLQAQPGQELLREELGELSLVRGPINIQCEAHHHSPLH
jgi:hypothetical protein